MMRVFLKNWTLALLLSSASAHEPALDTPHPTGRRQNVTAGATVVVRSASTNQPFVLPPLLAGVAELKFADLFEQPIGPRGLEYSDKARSLQGHRVRILGYMVRQAQPLPNRFLFSPVAAHLDEDEYGFAEDLPPQTIHVLPPREKTATNSTRFAFTPGLLLLTGTLQLGPQNEADGRISHVRLELDASDLSKTAEPEANSL